jgi:hypothetical protein
MKNEGIKKAIVIVSPAFFVCAMVVCFYFFSSGSSMFVEKFKSVKIFNIVNAKNIVDVQVDSDKENKIIVSPFDAKLIKERELNENAARHIEVYSDEKRYLILLARDWIYQSIC